MTTALRADHIYQRAYVLAESGTHYRAAEIVATLVAEGYPEAVELLNTDNIRADLSRVCGSRHGKSPLKRPRRI